MNKQKNHAFGKDIYLLGKDANGTLYWLEQATWDCQWYWGGGYVETYTNNQHPERARDIDSHQHFDSLFFKGNKDGYTAFYELFTDTPFTNNEVWKILELMLSFYIIREYSDTIHRGGAHYTSNPASGVIKSEDEYKRINEKVIPAIMNELYKILGGSEK